LFDISNEKVGDYSLWSALGDGTKMKSYHDSALVSRLDARDGDCYVLVEGSAESQKHRKKVYLVSDSRTLDVPWDLRNVGTVTSTHGIDTVYFSELVTTLEVDVDIEYDKLREMIHSLSRFKREVGDWRRLFLGWYDAAFARPLSFPVPISGSMKGQKKWQAHSSCIAVEVLPEPVENISKFSLCLHCFLVRPSFQPEPAKDTPAVEAPVEVSAEVTTEEASEASAASESTEATEEAGVTEEKAEEAVEKKVELEYWPPDHIRVLYDPNEPKMSWAELRLFLADRFQMKEESTHCAMYKITKKTWCLLDACDDSSEKALSGAPWNIKTSARDSQIFAVFESDDEAFINSVATWAPPPFSGKAKMIKSQGDRSGGPYVYEDGPMSELKPRRERVDGIRIDWD
jgi:hypothetical protein